MDWGGVIVGALGVAAAAVAGWWAFRTKKVETQATSQVNRDNVVRDRMDDASEMAKWIRGEIAAEVERQVKPIREELERVKRESHEMNDAVRARETQLWMWDHRGRAGDLPMLPNPILHRLGLGHLVPPDELDDTITMERGDR